MILLVDNYDSFTFNLYQYLGELGADVKVVEPKELQRKIRKDEAHGSMDQGMGFLTQRRKGADC